MRHGRERVGHEREREVGDGRSGIRRGEMGKGIYPTWTACDRVSY